MRPAAVRTKPPCWPPCGPVCGVFTQGGESTRPSPKKARVGPCVRNRANGSLPEKPSGMRHPPFPAEKHRVSLLRKRPGSGQQRGCERGAGRKTRCRRRPSGHFTSPGNAGRFKRFRDICAKNGTVPVLGLVSRVRCYETQKCRISGGFYGAKDQLRKEGRRIPSKNRWPRKKRSNGGSSFGSSHPL